MARSNRLITQKPVRRPKVITAHPKPRWRTKNVYRRKREGTGRLWHRLLYVAGSLCALGGISLGLVLLYYQLLTNPSFCIKDIKNIEIIGANRLSHLQIMALGKLGPETNLVALRPAVVEQALLTHPWIAKAEVTRRWPNRLLVRLEERDPVALVQLEELYYADRQGHLFRPLSPGDPHDFPVITGLSREHFTMPAGAPSVLFGRILGLLDLLKEAPPPLQSGSVAEIHVDPERGFTLYVKGLKSALELGFEDLPDKLQKFARVWPTLAQKGYLQRAGRINLDYPQRVLLSLTTMDDSK
jgi:cell division protein FtsQ